MPDANAAQTAWVTRVLDVTVPAHRSAVGAQDAVRRWQSACQAWQAASDAVDKQIDRLRVTLLSAGHDGLKQIAETGLNGMTVNTKVPLLAAIADIGAGDGDKLEKGRATALNAVRALQAHLTGDARIAACDENPFGVPLSIRATLGGALEQMEAALQG